MSQTDRQRKDHQRNVEYSLKEMRKVYITGEADYTLHTEDFPFIDITFFFSCTRKVILKGYLHIQSNQDSLDGLEFSFNFYSATYKQLAQEDYVSKSQDVLRGIVKKNTSQLKGILKKLLIDKIKHFNDRSIEVR